MTPASLQANYRSEIRKCGDPMYAFEQHWEGVSLSAENVEQARALGISQNFLDKNGRFFVTVSGRQPNYRTLSKDLQSGISSQIDDIIEQRFTFINYNGISATNVDKILPPDQPHIFDDSVIIIDEAHNLIGSVVNERLIKAKIYDMIINPYQRLLFLRYYKYKNTHNISPLFYIIHISIVYFRHPLSLEDIYLFFLNT
jgi:hypothetical protein